MPASEVLRVLAALEAAGCRVWLGGGWGVDALVGRQTRPHRDLDLAVDAAAQAPALVAVERLGYRVETDWRPVRVELVAPAGGWVDLHPVELDASGNGLQAGLDGASFFYPAGCFVSGTVGGRTVGCVSAEQQVVFHSGYPPRDVDIADLALLRGLVSGRGLVPGTAGGPSNGTSREGASRGGRVEGERGGAGAGGPGRTVGGVGYPSDSPRVSGWPLMST